MNDGPPVLILEGLGPVQFHTIVILSARAYAESETGSRSCIMIKFSHRGRKHYEGEIRFVGTVNA